MFGGENNTGISVIFGQVHIEDELEFAKGMEDMTRIGMESIAGVEVGATAVNAIGGQIGAVHEVVNAVASAIMPPTQDSASAVATVRQLTNVHEFSAMFRAGLFQQAALSEVVRSAAVTNTVTDAFSAGTIVTLPS